MTALRRLVAAIQALPPQRADSLLAAVAAALFVAEAVAASSGPTLAWSLAFGLPIIGLVAVRRRAPLPVLGLQCLLFLAQEAVGSPLRSRFLPFAVLVLGIYTVAAHRSRIETAVAAGLGLAVGLFDAIDEHGRIAPSDVVFMASVLTALPVLAGRGLRSRRRLVAELEAQTATLAAARDAQAEEAALEERRRIARELHDVVAHSVSVMVVQAGAARAVAARDTDAARASLETVEATGREALGEMRRLLGVMRRGDEDLALAPAPGIGNLEPLLQRARDGGLPVQLDVRGDPVPLPAGLDLAAYRVLQEALTNALRHGGAGHATVAVEYGPHELRLAVTDDGPGAAVPLTPGGGHGLVGMRERVEMYGGRLDAGPRPEGGFAVAARIPLGSGGP